MPTLGAPKANYGTPTSGPKMSNAYFSFGEGWSAWELKEEPLLEDRPTNPGPRSTPVVHNLVSGLHIYVHTLSMAAFAGQQGQVAAQSRDECPLRENLDILNRFKPGSEIPGHHSGCDRGTALDDSCRRAGLPASLHGRLFYAMAHSLARVPGKPGSCSPIGDGSWTFRARRGPSFFIKDQSVIPSPCYSLVCSVCILSKYGARYARDSLRLDIRTQKNLCFRSVTYKDQSCCKGTRQ